MSDPLIFSKKDRKNLVSVRRSKLTVKLSINRSQLDKMTLGEIKKLKSDAKKTLDSITEKQIRYALQNLNIKGLNVEVSLDPWGRY
jgi:hypothetical protein